MLNSENMNRKETTKEEKVLLIVNTNTVGRGCLLESILQGALLLRFHTSAIFKLNTLRFGFLSDRFFPSSENQSKAELWESDFIAASP